MFIQLTVSCVFLNVTLGLVGSVFAKEGGLPDVSNLVSGALKVFIFLYKSLVIPCAYDLV